MIHMATMMSICGVQSERAFLSHRNPGLNITCELPMTAFECPGLLSASGLE